MINFVIVGKMPSLNDVINKTRLNKFAGAFLKKHLQNDINNQLRKQITIKGLKCPLNSAVNIKFTFYEPNKKRDKDNIMSSQKFLLDSMVEVGILQNDGWKWINNLSYDFLIDKDYRVEIELTY